MPHYEAEDDLLHPRERIFDLVADVESYPAFLPGWIQARVIERRAESYSTEQIIGFGTFRARFRSTTFSDRPAWLRVVSTDGIFETFDLMWTFDPLPTGGCRARVTLEARLRSRVAQRLFDRALSRMVGSIIAAFEARADAVVGLRAGSGRAG